MSNLSVSKVQRKTKNDPQPTLSENFNSHKEIFVQFFFLGGTASLASPDEPPLVLTDAICCGPRLGEFCSVELKMESTVCFFSFLPQMSH
jgi:hypothetical protein